MKHVDFYLIGVVEPIARLKFCCQLVEKQYRNPGIHSIISEMDNLTQLDQYLWSHTPTSFIAHQLEPSQDPRVISLLTPKQLRPTKQGVVWLQDGDALPEPLLQCQHVLEVISQEPTILSNSRKRFRHYKNHGFDIKIHDLT